MKRSMLVLVCLACILFCACSPTKDDHGTQNNEIAAPAKEVEKANLLTDADRLSQEAFLTKYSCYSETDYDTYLSAFEEAINNKTEKIIFEASADMLHADICKRQEEAKKKFEELAKELKRTRDFSNDPEHVDVCTQYQCYDGYVKLPEAMLLAKALTTEWFYMTDAGVMMKLKSHLTETINAGAVTNELQLRRFVNGNLVATRVNKIYVGSSLSKDKKSGHYDGFKPVSHSFKIYPEDTFWVFFEVPNIGKCDEYALYLGVEELKFSSFLGTTSCGD